MGRKSKLTEKQWQEIERRQLGGESNRALAREFGISEASLREKTAKTDQVRAVAEQIVATERAVMELPISAQISAHNLAAKLRAISDSLASAAQYGAATSHRLQALANSEVAKIDDANPLTNVEALKGVALLTKLANESAVIPLNLLNANKERVKELTDPAEKNGAAYQLNVILNK